MGLDIFLQADNNDVLRAARPDGEAYWQLYHLSRSFCNFMSRRNVVENSLPELDQLGALTGVDIEPLYEMETYPTEETMAWELDMAKTEAERQQVLREAEEAKINLRGNLDRVQATVDGLLRALAPLDDLPARLDAGRFATLDYPVYFANLLQEVGSEPYAYLRKNFGQDLRTIQQFVDFARRHGSHTVYFEFG